MVPLVGLRNQPDDPGLQNPAGDGHVDRVGALADLGRVASADEEPLVHEVESASLALHEFEVVEDARQAVVPAAAGMKNVARSYSQREAARVHDFEAVRMQVQENIAALRVGPMDERVDEELADD